MDTYKRYTEVRDLVWRLLIDYRLTAFPLDIGDFCESLGVRLLSFDDAALFFKRYAIVPTRSAFAYSVHGKQYIFFDATMPSASIRFDLAHEYGHLVLRHVTDVRRNLDTYTESEANIFASRLLSPSIVAYIEGLDTPDKVSQFFGIGTRAAEIRFERLVMLTERGKFCSAPLESQYKAIYLLAKQKPMPQ